MPPKIGSEVYELLFPGKPIPLARPRLGKWGVYDSQSRLKKKSVECLMRQKWEKIHGAVAIYFEFRMPLPKCSKSKEEQMLKVHHIKRPDLSNMIKFYEDVLQPHVFDDDSQICELTARKVNSLVAETMIRVWRKDDEV